METAAPAVQLGRRDRAGVGARAAAAGLDVGHGVRGQRRSGGADHGDRGRHQRRRGRAVAELARGVVAPAVDPSRSDGAGEPVGDRHVGHRRAIGQVRAAGTGRGAHPDGDVRRVGRPVTQLTRAVVTPARDPPEVHRAGRGGADADLLDVDAGRNGAVVRHQDPRREGSVAGAARAELTRGVAALGPPQRRPDRHVAAGRGVIGQLGPGGSRPDRHDGDAGERRHGQHRGERRAVR